MPLESNGYLVEVTRSFSRKYNLGNYESCDMFASAKTQCFPVDFVRVSQELYQACKSQVLGDARAFLNPETEPEDPGTFTIETDDERMEKEASAFQQTIGTQAAADAVAERKIAELTEPVTEHVDEPARLRAIIMGGVKGSKKKHIAEYCAGWFAVGQGGPDSLGDIAMEDYRQPLEVLIVALDAVEGTGEMLIANPRELGVKCKDKYINRAEDPGEIAPPEPPSPTVDPPAGEWSDFMDIDPMLKKYSWTSVETLAYAKALMQKWGHDEEKFDKHMRFLKMDTLSEEDIVCLFKLLYHCPDGNALWRKAEARKVSLKHVFSIVEQHFGKDINMQSKSHDVLTAITLTIGEL